MTLSRVLVALAMVLMFSGCPADETRWEPGEGATPAEDCSVMNTDGLWSDTDCNTREYGFVCETEMWPTW